MSHGSRWRGFLCLLWLTACMQSGEEPTELSHLTVGLEVEDGGIRSEGTSAKSGGDVRADCAQPTPGQPTCPECRAYPVGDGRYTINLPSNLRLPVYFLAPERPQGVHVWPHSSFPTRTVSDRVVIDVNLTTANAASGKTFVDDEGAAPPLAANELALVTRISDCGGRRDFILWIGVSELPEPPLGGGRFEDPRCRNGTARNRCHEP